MQLTYFAKIRKLDSIYRHISKQVTNDVVILSII